MKHPQRVAIRGNKTAGLVQAENILDRFFSYSFYSLNEQLQ